MTNTPGANEMPKSKTGKDAARAAGRKEEALALRVRGLTMRAIAKQLGVSVSTAHGYVKEGLEECAANALRDADKVRELELERVSAVLAEASSILVTEDAELRLKAADRVLKAAQRVSELNGLVTKTHVVTEDVSSMSNEEIERRLKEIEEGKK